MNSTLTINYTDGTEDCDIELDVSTWLTLGEAMLKVLEEYRGDRIVSSFVLVTVLPT